MKEACEKTGLSYETLKYYCNQGLVPNVKRDGQNHRIFDDRDVKWINSLICLKNCSMGIVEMQRYVALCLALEAERRRIDEAITYIDWKQGYYENLLSGKSHDPSNQRYSGSTA